MAIINGNGTDGTRTANWFLGVASVVVVAGILWLLTSSYAIGVAVSRIETKIEGIERGQDRQDARDAAQDKRIENIERRLGVRRVPQLRPSDDDD